MEKSNSGKNFENQAMRTNAKRYRNRYWNRILAVVLCLSLIFGLCPALPGLDGYEEVHAEPNNDSEDSIYSNRVLGTDVLNTEDVNSLKAPVVWYAGKEWYVIGYNTDHNTNILSEYGTATLFAKDNIGTSAFDNSRASITCTYKGSDLQKYLDNVYSGSGEQTVKFSSQEKDAVKTRELISQKIESDEDGFDHDKIYGEASESVKDAGLWPLSLAEAYVLKDNNFRRVSNWWWLRSPGDYARFACYVSRLGRVYSDGLSVDDSDFGVRPAFYLNLQSVIFSSKIKDATDSAGAEYKLTLADPEIKLAVTEYTAPINDTTTATVKYKFTGSDAGNVDKLSVLILPCTYVPGMSLEDILFYGEVTSVGEIKKDGNEGSGTFELPAELKNQTSGVDYYIYLLAEDVNDGNLTDYASEPVPVTSFKTVTGLATGSIKTEDVNTADSPIVYYAGNPWYMIGYDKEHSDENILSESGAATLLAKDNLGTSEFDTDANRGDTANNKYNGSLLQKYLDNVYNGSGEQTVRFSSQEKNSVLERTLTGGGGVYNTNPDKKDNEGNIYDEDKIRGDQVEDAGLWPLSVKEANKLYDNDENDSIRANRSYWWLRSPGDYAYFACYVDYIGRVSSNGYGVDDDYYDEYGVRPAFYLNLQSVIFSSLINPAPAGVSAGAAHKLTLKDDKICIGLQADKNITRTGNVVSIPYNITNTDQSGNHGAEVNQISLMILDKVYTPRNTNEAKLLCYKILSKAEANSEFLGEGNISFTLPKDFARKSCGTDYHAYIIAESVNDQSTDGMHNLKNTDYAGTPYAIAIPHEHDFSYAAGTGDDANSIIATCLNKGCSLTDSKILLTIEAPAYNTYGSTDSKAATLTGLDAFNTATGKSIEITDIKYAGIDETSYQETTVPPECAGKYKAFITVEEKTAEVSYEIYKADTAVSTSPSALAITYGDTLAQSSISGGTVTASISGESTVVAGTFAWKNETIKPVVADSGVTTFKVIFNPNDSDNYKNVEADVTLTVNLKEITVSGITVKDKAYNGSKGAELDCSNAELNGVIDADKAKISISANGEYTDENAGTGKSVSISNLALVDLVGSGSGSVIGNYVLSGSGQQTSASGSITKANTVISVAPSVLAITYGQTLAESSISGGKVVSSVSGEEISGTFSWFDDTLKPAVSDSGTTEYELTFTPNDTTNYNAPISASIKVTVNPKEVKVSAITAEDKDFDGNTEATLNYDGVQFEGILADDEGKLSVSAKGTFKDADAGKDKDVTISDLKLSGTAVANYVLAAAGNQEKTTASINKADSSVTKKPVAKEGLVYSGTEQELVTAGTVVNGKLVYAVTDKGAAEPEADKYADSIPTKTEVDEYTVYFKSIGNKNYNDTSVEHFDVKILAKTVDSPEIELSLDEYTYDGNAKEPSVSVKDGKIEIPAEEYTVEYSDNTEAGTALVTIKDKTGGNYEVSGTKEFTIVKASQKAPKLTSTDETISGKKDGSISGLTTDMEISTTGADTGFETVSIETIRKITGTDSGSGSATENATDIPGDGFASGKYYVRFAEDKNHEASPATEITINPGKKLIVYFMSDGKTINTVELDYDAMVTKPDNPVKSGYTFAGWFKDEAHKEAYNFDQKITEDTDIYAYWTKNKPSGNNSGSTYVPPYTPPASSEDPKKDPDETETKTPEPTPGVETSKVHYPDGTVATFTKKTDKDGTVTETKVTEYTSGRKETVEKVYDKDKKLISTFKETIRKTKGGTEIVETSINKADGYSYNGSKNTYTSGKVVTEYTETTANKTKRYFKETVNKNGTVSTESVVTDAKGKTKLRSSVKGNDSIETLKVYSVKTDGKAKLEIFETGKKKVTVPEKVTFNGVDYEVNSIAKKAFAGNETITQVKIGDNIRYIGTGAFKNAVNLAKIYIDAANLRKVYAGAFSGIAKDAEFIISAPDKKTYKKARKKLIQSGLPEGATITRSK